jgi:hypothetical protein
VPPTVREAGGILLTLIWADLAGSVGSKPENRVRAPSLGEDSHRRLDDESEATGNFTEHGRTLEDRHRSER